MPKATTKTKARPLRADAATMLGARIKDEARNQGLCPNALARAAGVHPSQVLRFFSGEHPDLRMSTASKLLAALGLRLVSGRAPRSIMEIDTAS